MKLLILFGVLFAASTYAAGIVLEDDAPQVIYQDPEPTIESKPNEIMVETVTPFEDKKTVELDIL